ncbi:MAG: CHASE2 domain-containing protein [Synechococcales cyanobacterium RU_4_20]|nr:CHASE2 domain-containing protein [Synechococcales cyanobacterium RU_4_20]
MTPPRFDAFPQQIPPDFQRSYRARLLVWKAIIPPGLVLVALILVTRLLGWLQPLELVAFDTLLRNLPLESPEARITLVGITEADIQKLNHYPVQDAELSQALRNLAAAKPRVLGLGLFRDIEVPPGYDQLRQTFAELPNLVALEVIDGTGQATIPAPPGIPPDRVGFANFLEDSDWILRRSLLTSGKLPNGQVKPAFALRLAQAYLAPEGYRLKLNGNPERGRGKGKNLSFYSLKGGPRSVLHPFDSHLGGYIRTPDGEVDQAQLTMLKFRRHSRPFELISLEQVLNQQFDPELVRDRIILIGNIAPSIKDDFLAAGVKHTLWGTETSYQGSVPFIFGLEVHAHLTSQIISQVLARRGGIESLPEWLEYGAIAIAGLAGTGLGLVLVSPLGRLLGVSLLSSGLLLLCYVSLTVGLWLPLVPSLMALIGAGLMTLFVDRELHLKLSQSNSTLEWAYTSVHNGPLQTLVVALRQARSNPVLYAQLQLLNGDLRLIYESMRDELNRVGEGSGEARFCLNKQWLNAQDDLPELLLQVHQTTLDRNCPGFDSLRICMRPRLEPLRNCSLIPAQRRLVCLFLEEALCNVGKHAVAANRLDVLGINEAGWCRLQVIDNGQMGGERVWAGQVQSGQVQSEQAQVEPVQRQPVPMDLNPPRAGRSRWMGEPSALFTRRSKPRQGQGSRQSLAIARALGGKFERFPNHPQGTICQLSWPNKQPVGLRWKLHLQQWFKRL